MTVLDVRVVRLAHASGLPLPRYATDGAAGADLHAAIAAPLLLSPGERALVPTGLCIQLPLTHEAQVRPRSGLAIKHGTTVLNAPGTIDADYRGEISVVLINHSDAVVTIDRGERIAQLVIAPVTRAAFNEVDTLEPTQRGPGGFGSTGRTT